MTHLMRKPKLHVYNLILEVTRRCNMSCPHCLRGEPENKDMQPDTINAVLANIASINTISFTGGEPTLNPEAIRHTLDTVKRNKIPIQNIFIAINGSQVTDEFLKICDDWHSYCITSSYNPPEDTYGLDLEKWQKRFTHEDLSENIIGCTLTVSSDNFHDIIPMENLIKLATRNYVYNLKANTKTFDQHSAIIASGRALDNFDSTWLRQPIQTELEYDYDGTDSDQCRIEELYINVNGDILTNCDLSYDDQEKYRIGTISTENATNWTDIIYNIIQTKEDKK